jgi:hypothetical protein
MSDVRIRWWSKIFLCGAAAAACAGCGAEAEHEAAAEITACSAASAGAPWANQGFVAQSRRLIVELAATPSASGIDAVVGLSDGPATQFRQLAAIVRFNPAGMIDARAGSVYRADASIPYTAGTAYRFRIHIDVQDHTYSVDVATGSRAWTSLARAYPFRAEQAQVGELSNLAVKVDSSTGAVQVCDLQITAIDDRGCPVAQPGMGFVPQSIGQPGEVVVSWTFEATPDRILDGVVGLSQARATSFADLAAAVRFAPSGVIDARNGGAYQADAVVPYTAGQPRQIRIIADVPSQTYSAYVAGGGAPPVQLARRYSFRSSGTAHWISELAAIVDSDEGELAVCDQAHGVSIGVRFLREGSYAIAPLPGEASLISDGATTWRLDSSGRTQAQLARGGQIAVDPAGNVYLARIAGTNLIVESYTSGFAARWTRSYPAGDGKRVLAIGADGASVVAAAGPVSGGVDLVKRWLTDGTESITRAGPMADAVAIGPAGLVLGSAIHGTVVVTKWPLGPSPAPEWQRSWLHGARIDAMAIAPDGRVSFGGRFVGSISFGGPVVAPSPDGNNTYAAALTSTGEHQFSRGLGQPAVLGMAAGGSFTAVSTHARAMVLLDDGHELRGEFGQNPVRGAGTPAGVAVGSGRVYWNFALTPLPGAPSYPYLIVYEPGV